MRHDEERPAVYDWDQTIEFEYLLNMPLSSLTTDRIEDLQSKALQIIFQSTFELILNGGGGGGGSDHSIFKKSLSPNPPNVSYFSHS